MWSLGDKPGWGIIDLPKSGNLPGNACEAYGNQWSQEMGVAHRNREPREEEAGPHPCELPSPVDPEEISGPTNVMRPRGR